MTNIFGVGLQPLLLKISEFTAQQNQIIALLKENNFHQAKNSALLEEINNTLKEKK